MIMQQDFEHTATLHVGVGRANNSNNVGNVNNVYGVAASNVLNSCLKVFADVISTSQAASTAENQVQAQHYPCCANQTEQWLKVCSIDTLQKAAYSVCGYVNPREHLDKLKASQRGFLEHEQEQLADLQKRLQAERYEFSPYAEMTVYEPKERKIDYHSDWLDNVAETSYLSVFADTYKSVYSPHTYGGIKGRGTTKMLKFLQEQITQRPKAYFLQMDVRKYYQSINLQTLKMLSDMVIKAAEPRKFVHTLIDSFDGGGIPIGVPLSQFHANLYLTPVDLCLERSDDVIAFARNMDDIGIVVKDKYAAQRVRKCLDSWLTELSLTMKPDYRIAPLTYGMDILGYVIYPTHTRIRKRTKLHFKQREKQLRDGGVSIKTYKQQLASFYGWCKHGDCRHLLQSVMGDKLKLYMKYKRLSELRPSASYFGLGRDRFVSITTLDAKEVLILEWRGVTIKGKDKAAVRFCFTSEIAEEPTEEELSAKSHYTITRSAVVRDRLERDKDLVPFAATFHCGKYTSYR